MLRHPTEDDPASTRTGLRFKLLGDLIYYTNQADGRERLCIPNSLEQEIFKQAHDEQHHSGYHRSYDRVYPSIYMRHLARNLKSYIEHCPECQLNQTKRHKPHGNLVPIDRPGIPFHTICMDFIVALPLSNEGYDSLLTITCKFSKRLLLVPGKSTWSAAEWADVVLPALVAFGWGIPCGIISDRDTKFMSVFWQAVFNKLGTNLLTATAYHPQSDGQSERTNQTVEIAIRFYVTAHGMQGSDWPLVLPYLQGSLNNSKNSSIDSAPNEIIYGFKVRDTLGMLADLPSEHFDRLRLMKREQAEDSMAFANAAAKARYDRRHKPITLAVGSKAFLKLHDGYEIPGVHPKLGRQRVGPFTVLERVGQLAYRLELRPNMRIHPVVSIAQLEPAKSDDPYNRSQHDDPGPVEETIDTSTGPGDPTQPYEVERVLGKRPGGKSGVPSYLIKWRKWGHEHNTWYSANKLKNCQGLIAEYENKQRPPESRSLIPYVPTNRQDVTPATVVPVKRGRGRPRKNPVPQ